MSCVFTEFVHASICDAGIVVVTAQFESHGVELTFAFATLDFGNVTPQRVGVVNAQS